MVAIEVKIGVLNTDWRQTDGISALTPIRSKTRRAIPLITRKWAVVSYK